MRETCLTFKDKSNQIKDKTNSVITHPVEEWKQDDLQLVPDILVIHLKIILGIGKILADLFRRFRLG